ncbi:ABC transporter permease [Paenibacillus antibioticophila]|uniref:ABC transporter permease n=1 Tax=Paenibacillus antibioticophila TaxID=1274374 RepID=UPI0005CA51B0|nr:ABC transporter permease [Paenibacillus antibioticophila]
MMLFKKMLRDIKHAKAQFLTIIIIAACGVFTFVGAITVGNRLEESVNQFYNSTEMNDVWINVEGASAQDIDAIKELPGIEAAQGRTVMKVFSENRVLDLFVLNENILSKPYLASGEPFQSESEGLWLDQEFAKANGLNIGGTIQVHAGDGKSVPVKIQGLVLSPEKLIDVSSETLSTRHDLYGYAYMSEAAAYNMFSSSGLNQLLIKLRPEENIQTLLADVEQVLGKKYVNSLTHEEHTSTSGAASQIGQFKTIAYVTPMLFFLLAILVVISTMSRLITNQRVQIGTLMSLGVPVRTIKWHYLSYGLFLGITGGSIGLIAGYYVIPAIFMGTLHRSFTLPRWSESFPIETLWSIAAVSGCCVLAVLFACRGKLNALPVIVLKGEAPSRPKKSLMESIVHSKATFSFQRLWLLRNLRSRKVRGAMGIVGSFGCAFLILFGFANIDTSNKSIEVEFDRQYLYEYKADLLALNAEQAQNTNWNQAGIQPIQERRVVIKSAAAQRNLPVTIIGSGDYINLDVTSPDVMPVPESGVVLSRKMADVLGVKAGSAVSLRIDGGQWKEIVVSETIQSPVADRMFVSEAAWRQHGEIFVPNALLLGDQAAMQAAKEHYPVTQIIAKEDMKEANRALNEGVFASAAGLTIAAIFLGIAVIYSLGLINLTEMSRQFATLKVLGFYHREIRKLLFQESFLLTAIGIILALPAGWGAIHLLDQANMSEGLMLFPKIKLTSYLTAIGLTLLCSFIVNMLMSRKLKDIDMVTSLKSAD